MKILIADDSSTIRRLFEVLLKKWGYETVVVEDGLKAWEILSGENPPSVALLDWMMPGMDGIEICRKVGELRLSNPPYLILVTGRNTKEDLVYGLEAGADDYITKPVDPNELRARVRVGVRMVELRSALAQRVRELEAERNHVKTLQGLIPICMHCHRIRDDAEIWQKLETYLEQHSEAAFSHSLCPECLEKFYPSQEDGDKKTEEQGQACPLEGGSS